MTKFLLAGAAALAIGVPAGAQMADWPRGNWDKPVTRADNEAKVRERFAENDTNRDGFITSEEMRARVETRIAEGRGRAFDRLDTDRNGSISREEFEARTGHRERMVERRIERRMDGKPGDAPKRNIVIMHGGPGGMMVRMADGNGDGRISLEESLAASRERFDRMDTNKDGTLTREERITSMHAWGERMRDWGNKMRQNWRDAPPPPPPPAG